MAEILNNDFYNDKIETRTARLILLSSNIAEHAAALGLTAEIVDWGEAAKEVWIDALSESNLRRGEAETASEDYRRIFAEGKVYYQKLKGILKANLKRYGAGAEIYELYGVERHSPKSLDEFYAAGRKFVEANEEFTAEGAAFALPESLVSELAAKIDATSDAWETAKSRRREARTAFADRRRIYTEDGLLMRVVHSHAKLVWGADNPLVEDLGFATVMPRRGGAVPSAPSGLAFNPSEREFTWDPLERATSYQLIYEAYDSSGNSLVAYAGRDVKTRFDPDSGRWIFRVKARNKHGFGELSDPIEVIV